MKRSPFLLAFIFAAGSLHAQSKAETLKWISDKINAYNNNETFYCPIENANNFWTYKSTCDAAGLISENDTWNDETTSSLTVSTADLVDLINVTIEQDDRCEKKYTYIQLVFKPNTVWWKNKDKTGKSNLMGLYLKWNSEDDLLNRIVKAFRHLIDLQKPKEIF